MLTAGIDYGVEVLTAYENRRVGQVIYPPALLRDALLRRGLVRRVEPTVVAKPASEPAEPELMVMTEPEHRQSRKPIHSKMKER